MLKACCTPLLQQQHTRGQTEPSAQCTLPPRYLTIVWSASGALGPIWWSAGVQAHQGAQPVPGHAGSGATVTVALDRGQCGGNGLSALPQYIRGRGLSEGV